ncbi:MAG: helix-turn-helix domain-containing protein [Alphaproteobacteria bacterium]|nr:helix-turn-helix domain-containing protein [Alphaproteobacteria bacterium]
MIFANRYLTTGELADLLHIKRNTIERWRTSKICPIPWTRIGGRVLYDCDEVMAYLDQQKRNQVNSDQRGQ